MVCTLKSVMFYHTHRAPLSTFDYLLPRQLDTDHRTYILHSRNSACGSTQLKCWRKYEHCFVTCSFLNVFKGFEDKRIWLVSVSCFLSIQTDTTRCTEGEEHSHFNSLHLWKISLQEVDMKDWWMADNKTLWKHTKSNSHHCQVSLQKSLLKVDNVNSGCFKA